MNKLTRIAAAVALAAGIASPASALVLTAGDLKITINAFDGGTTGYGNAGGVKCTTVATCDAVAGISQAPGSIGSEDTWGIFSVQSITNVTTGSLFYFAGQNGEYLTGIFGGIKDKYVEVAPGSLVTGPSTTALGTGGWLNLYLNNQNYNASFGPAGRTGEKAYTGITNIGGTLALSAVFGNGVLGGSPGYSYLSNFANNTISGGSQGFLDVTGGMWKNEFDTNAQFDPNGGAHDLFLKVTYGQTGASRAAGWTVDASGDAMGEVQIPEPGSLALLGLGLAGIAMLRRRKA